VLLGWRRSSGRLAELGETVEPAKACNNGQCQFQAGCGGAQVWIEPYLGSIWADV
jgi:hypothetical protein